MCPTSPHKSEDARGLTQEEGGEEVSMRHAKGLLLLCGAVLASFRNVEGKFFWSPHINIECLSVIQSRTETPRLRAIV